MPFDLQLLDVLAVGLFAVQLVLIFALVVWALRLEKASEGNGIAREGDGIGLPAPAPLLAGWYGYGTGRAMADLNGASMRAAEGEQ